MALLFVDKCREAQVLGLEEHVNRLRMPYIEFELGTHRRDIADLHQRCDHIMTGREELVEEVVDRVVKRLRTESLPSCGFTPPPYIPGLQQHVFYTPSSPSTCLSSRSLAGESGPFSSPSGTSTRR